MARRTLPVSLPQILASRVRRKNRELTYRVLRKYMRVDNPKLLDFS